MTPLRILCGVVLLVLGCRATTGRPSFDAFPEAEHVQLGLGYSDKVQTVMQVTDTVAAYFLADSLPVIRIKAFDGYLETDWFDTTSGRPSDGRRLGQDVVKIRAWINPTRPGYVEVEAETVYQPMADPSRPARELERPVPPGHPVNRRVAAVLEKLTERYGLPDADPKPAPGGPPIAVPPAPGDTAAVDTLRAKPDTLSVPPDTGRVRLYSLPVPQDAGPGRPRASQLRRGAGADR